MPLYVLGKCGYNNKEYNREMVSTSGYSAHQDQVPLGPVGLLDLVWCQAG
jgi:hypothetical protein